MEGPQQDQPRAQHQRGKRYGNENVRGSRRGNYRGRRGSRARGSEPSHRSTALNCIVDESALLAGLAAADGLKKWIVDGSINLYVPLYTLEKLNNLRSSPPPLNLDARKTLEWLDDITSATENKPAGHVELQGPDHQYQTWEEVEKFLLPETPLSSGLEHNSLDGMMESFENGLMISNGQHNLHPTPECEGPSPSSPNMPASSNSPHLGEEVATKTSDISHNRIASQSSAVSDYSADWDAAPTNGFYPAKGTSSIPGSVRPLLNYVVWRTYNANASIAGTGRYLLLTDDPATRKQAQQFGVRAKLLSEVRSIVSRAENRQESHKRGDTAFPSAESRPTTAQSILSTGTHEREAADEEEEVVFDPALRVGSANGASPKMNVWDPDHFGRTPVPLIDAEQPVSVFKDTSTSGKRRVSRGNPTRSSQGRGRSSRQYRGNGPPSPRAQADSTRGAGPPAFEQPIDPDSYARPRPPSRRGRGGFRKLWDPNT